MTRVSLAKVGKWGHQCPSRASKCDATSPRSDLTLNLLTLLQVVSNIKANKVLTNIKALFPPLAFC